ncbi:MAG: nicotinamide-nucleotide amidohydrolase family protein, partial [Planctomycetota bacterium]
MSVDVALVLVGDELLTGRRRDANGVWVARHLTDLGLSVVGWHVSGDDASSVAQAVREATQEARVVLVCGGLGPTEDDATREGLARAAGVDLVQDAAAFEAVRAAQAARGHEMDERRAREALVPRGAHPVTNPEGTAPGLALDLAGTAVWALPGPPREFRAMFEEVVRPALEALPGRVPAAHEAFRVAGRREPDVASALQGVGERHGVTLSFYPHEGELTVRFEARGRDGGERVRRAAGDARERLRPGDVYGDQAIEFAVVDGLRRNRWTVTTAESMTGGLVARMLVRVPGASEVFFGGWITYSDAWKLDALDVSEVLLAEHGAVSEPVARTMAEGARRRAGVDVALAVTGIAGPGDGRDPAGRAVVRGTWFGALAR